MADTLSRVERSKRMGLVRSKDTKPERMLRSMIHRMGFRYRLHDRSLPGTPDIVFRRLKKVIFLHGCFWHRHAARACQLARLPKSRLDFWQPKLEQNRLRDKRIGRELIKMGWQSLTIWECQLKNPTVVSNRVQSFLKDEID